MGAKHNYNNQDTIIEEVEDIIKVHKSGHVERLLVTPCVTPFLATDLDVTARDIYIDVATNVWARIYVPRCNNVDSNKFPLIVYFHGGGFCVGSTAWKCYHNFLGDLSSKSRCIIVSVNYRLAPENPLPAAFEDGIKALMWVKQQEIGPSTEYWTRNCDFSSIFLGGDSSGANISYNVALNLGVSQIRGIFMIQPFFGGEERTDSEKFIRNVSRRLLALSLADSDTYWRLALPKGENRDHPWSNPLRKNARKLEDMRVMVCIAEEDILRDRSFELCSTLVNEGNKVEQMIYKGVGHGFHVLDKSQLSQIRKKEMISDIVAFISA